MKSIQFITVVLLGLATLESSPVVAQTAEDQSAKTDDALKKEMVRCKALQEKAVNDLACQAASKEVSRRFFAPPTEYRPSQVDTFPSADKEHWTNERQPIPQPAEKQNE